MNGYFLNILLNHSIVFAAIAGIARVKYIPGSYYPFLLFLWLAFANETLSLVLVESHHSNSINSNIYVLCEYIILLFQFYKWKGGKTLTFFLLTSAGIIVWITDNFILYQITSANSIFRSFASFVIIFCSIDKVNRLIVYEKGRLQQNAAFLACIAFLFFYGCKAFVEVFHIFQVPFSSSFFAHLWLTLSVVNCFSNVIYAIAVVCIPRKEEFILPY